MKSDKSTSKLFEIECQSNCSDQKSGFNCKHYDDSHTFLYDRFYEKKIFNLSENPNKNSTVCNLLEDLISNCWKESNNNETFISCNTTLSGLQNKNNILNSTCQAEFNNGTSIITSICENDNTFTRIFFPSSMPYFISTFLIIYCIFLFLISSFYLFIWFTRKKRRMMIPVRYSVLENDRAEPDIE